MNSARSVLRRGIVQWDYWMIKHTYKYTYCGQTQQSEGGGVLSMTDRHTDSHVQQG